MARGSRLGSKIRRLRRERDMTQVRLAERLAISPSYLNMIEHNERPLTVPLLLKLSQALDVDLQVFSEGEEARLRAELAEALGDAMFRDLDLPEGDVDDLVNVSPSLCNAILTLYRAYRNARHDVEALSGRLAESPFLSESSHKLRSLITSVRSFSEILLDNVDLAAEERQKFLAIVVAESERLTSHVNELLGFIAGEGLQGLLRTSSPLDEVNDFIESNDNYFPDIEAAAEGVRRELGAEAAGLYPRLAGYLSERHGETVDMAPLEAEGGERWTYDAENKRLALSRCLPPSGRNFQVARQIGLRASASLIEDTLGRTRLSSAAAAELCRDFLAKYFAGALLMPYEAFLEAARAVRYDLELLGQRFDASFEQVCHRLTTLRRPGEAGVPFHFVRVDRAGNISKRFAGSGLPVPRFGGACPRWNVHAVHGAGGRIDTQIGQLPDGNLYFCIAKAVAKPGPGYGRPESHFAVAIGCRLQHAHQVAYADGLDLEKPGPVIPIGINCRICQRTDCGQRAFPSLTSPDARQPGGA